MPKSHVAIAILSAALVTCIAASENSQKRRSQPAQQVAPFDITIEALPPNYQGLNIEAVFKQLSLRSAKLTKGEFETTEQHRHRLKLQESTPILANLTVSDLLAFRIDRIESEYNADLQSLSVAIDVGRVFGATSVFKDLSTLAVKTNFINETSYIGTNAFGVRTRVSSYRSYGYELAYTNTGDFAVSKYVKQRYKHLSLNADDALLIELRLDAATAMKAKGNLRALAVVRPVSPYVSEYTWYTRPTLKSPTSAHNVTRYLKTYLAELWLYDLRTGHIYRKIRPGMLEQTVQVTAEPPRQKVWLQLENGRLIEVDEAWEQGDTVWYKKGNITMHSERDRVKVVRKPRP